MAHIKKIKTFHGLRYAVVEPFTSTIVVTEKSKVEGAKDTKKVITKTEDLAVEYKTGTGVNERVLPAVFPVTAEGLEKAKEIQALFNKKNKNKKKK